MAGIACARVLDAAGLKVRVFDKGRGPGGRMSTRRVGQWHFDHGAHYLTARDTGFHAQIQTWAAMGLVEPWTGNLVRLCDGAIHPLEDEKLRYVGVPGMSAIIRHFARNLDVRLNTEVKTLTHDAGSWRLGDFAGTDLGPFDTVVVALPAPQTSRLTAGLSALAERAAVAMAPCWSLMLGFEQPLEIPFDGAFIDHPVLAWIARNNSKPERPGTEAWVLHATRKWSVEQLPQGGEQVAAMLMTAFAEVTGKSRAPALRINHRWRFAEPLQAIAAPCLYERALRIGACGDWCLGHRIEDAWLSGRSLAARILEKPVVPTQPAVQ